MSLKDVQLELAKKKYPVGAADGKYGPVTEKAILLAVTAAPVYVPVVVKPPVKPAVSVYSVKDHKLFKDGLPVSYKASPNHGGEIEPELIVIHYTGDNGTGGLEWLTTKGSGVSAHLWISKVGVVWQLLPFNVRAWHAGASEWDGVEDVNSWSIGIECQGMGDNWPVVQIDTLVEVCKALHAAYDISGVAGHDEVATPEGRKVDPGPNFPWTQFLIKLGYEV